MPVKGAAGGEPPRYAACVDAVRGGIGGLLGAGQVLRKRGIDRPERPLAALAGSVLDAGGPGGSVARDHRPGVDEDQEPV